MSGGHISRFICFIVAHNYYFYSCYGHILTVLLQATPCRVTLEKDSKTAASLECCSLTSARNHTGKAHLLPCCMIYIDFLNFQCQFMALLIPMNRLLPWTCLAIKFFRTGSVPLLNMPGGLIGMHVELHAWGRVRGTQSLFHMSMTQEALMWQDWEVLNLDYCIYTFLWKF